MSKQIDWGDDSGDKISVEASEFSGNQVLRVTSQQNTRAYKRSIAIVVTSSSDPTKKATINLSQEAAPATLSLNVQSLVFSQRADSLEVQLTTNDNWQTSSNDEIPIPDEVTLKYNPWTDMVEMVGQPQQVYDAIEASDDYVMAMVRIGYSNVEFDIDRWDYTLSPAAVNSLIDPRFGVPPYKEILRSNLQNPKYHRIIPRAYMREPGEVRVKQGINPSIYSQDLIHSRVTQAYLFEDSALINKPGKPLGLRGYEMAYPTTLSVIVWDGVDYWLATKNTSPYAEGMSRSLLSHITAVKFSFNNNKYSFVAPFTDMSIDARSANGPIGYILYKKKGTSGYVVRGFDSVSNFALARTWIDSKFILSKDKKTMIATAHFGDL